MTNREVYQAALAILGEVEEDCADYEARMPMLLAAFGQKHAAIDRFYREAHGLAGQWGIAVGAAVEPDAPFDLSDRFAPMAAYDLAAQLVGRDNPVFAEQCAKRAAQELAQITREEMPATVHLISAVQDS